MKRIIVFLTGLSALVSCSVSPLEKEVRSQLKGMTLEEKVGQMILLEYNQIAKVDPLYAFPAIMNHPLATLDSIITAFGLEGDYCAADMVSALNPEDFQTMYPYYALSLAIARDSEIDVDENIAKVLFGDLHVGSMLNMVGGSEASDAVTWRRIMRKIDSLSWEYNGQPCLYGLDEMHGSTYVSDGTIFPHAIGIGATFNRDIASSMGRVAAYESRAAGVRWIYGPVLDMGMRPTWSRNYETYGEDPYLNAELGVSYIREMQGDNRDELGDYNVATCLKHYMGYSAPDNGRDRNPATLTIADLREKHFYPFKRAIEAGALSVMTNSSIINGESGVANKTFLTDWLKDGLDWDGAITTDWADVDAMVTSQHTAATVEEALEKVVNAGVDIIMVPSKLDYGQKILDLVREGRISRSRIDDAAARVIRLKLRTGLYDRKYPDPEDYPLFGGEEFARMSYEAALESEVLLKNEGGVLPLGKDTRILVCGPNANTMRTLHGGWTYTWQGINAEKFTDRFHTILEAVQEKFGTANVVYEPGVEYVADASDAANNRWQEDYDAGIGRAVAKAAGVDVILACVGENSYAETVGSIDDANISSNQSDLVKALAATGKPVILILNEGRPRLITRIEPLCPAIVDILLPGDYGADALAALLSGEENFSGRLPFTYPLNTNSFTNYWYKTCENRSTTAGIYNYSAHTNVQWWFGEGLSYTEFSYSDFKADRTQFGPDDEINFCVTVTNTGNRPGKEAVLLYSSDVAASITPDNRRLRAFDKIELQPGESREVKLSVSARDLAFADVQGRMTLEKGSFVMAVGGQTLELECNSDWKE